MADIFKQLGTGNLPAAEAAATVVDGVGTVPASKRWNAKVVFYNTNATTARVVTAGLTDSGSNLVIGEFLMKAESMAALERREFGLRSYPAGFVIRGTQASGTDVQWEIIGIEQDV